MIFVAPKLPHGRKFPVSGGRTLAYPTGLPSGQTEGEQRPVDIRGSKAGIRGRSHTFRPTDPKAADVIMGVRKRCGEVAFERPSVSLGLGCGQASNRHMVLGSAVGAWGAEQNEHLKAKPCRHRRGYRASLN